MDKSRHPQLVGIAKYFSEAQIRDFFIRYLSLIIVVEIFLLLIMLCGSVAVYKQPFPTKMYLILALSLPLGITFLLGIFVIAFNTFVFDKANTSDADADKAQGAQGAWFSKGDLFLNKIYKIPFIVKLLLTAFIVPVLFKLDDIIGYFTGIGAQAVRHLMMVAIALIGAAAIIGIVWMVVNFRLKKKQMDYEYRYRKDIMDKLELMVLNNDTLIDRNGNVISIKAPEKSEQNAQIVDGDYEICPLSMDNGDIDVDRRSLS
ncbi:MAG: hypothetical protein PVJ84_13745 [Desulfobacteraceae bacterium]|jgi:hypothetical protein